MVGKSHSNTKKISQTDKRKREDRRLEAWLTYKQSESSLLNRCNFIFKFLVIDFPFGEWAHSLGYKTIKIRSSVFNQDFTQEGGD